jgi:hypothetical protein
VPRFNIGAHLFLGDTIIYPHTRVHKSAPKKEAKRETLICSDVRKEKCIAGGLGPILAIQPQMIASENALPTRADIRIPIIVSQFQSLVHPTVSVSQIGRLRCAQMSSKAFFPTRLDVRIRKHRCNHLYASSTTHNPIAFAKCTKPPSASTHGSLRPEMITYDFSCC